MAKLPKLKYVKFVRAKGKIYAYFNTGKIVDGKLVWASLPPFSSPGFYDSYSTHLGHRARKHHEARTLSSVIDAYMAHDDYTLKSEGTQKTYRSALKRIRSELGDLEISEIGKAEIREMLDNRLPGPGAKNTFLSLMTILYQFARDREWTKADPLEGFKTYETGEWMPWPESVLNAALVSDDDMVRLGTHMLYYTGQRIGDVLKMRWSDITHGRLALTQKKTNKVLSIPLHSDLVKELERAPRHGLVILTHPDGERISVEQLRLALQTFAENLGHEVVPHGLRKNAVISLLECGCTVAETASVSGQSYQMVEYYARQIDQKRLSTAAILKFEAANAKGTFKRVENT